MQCVSMTWCLGVSGFRGHTFIYDGDTWTHDLPGTPDGAQVLSCVSRTFCLAEITDDEELRGAQASQGSRGSDDGGYLQRWDGASWTLVSQLHVSSFYEDARLSCGAVTLCALTDAEGGVYTFSGKNYRTTHFTPKHFIDSVACSGPSSCLALGRGTDLGGPGKVWIFNGSTWSSPTTSAPGSSMSRCRAGRRHRAPF